METVALLLCGKCNMIQFMFGRLSRRHHTVSHLLWAALCQPLISFEFIFSLHLTDILTTTIRTCIQLQCATITRSFKSIVRVLHDEERKTKLRQWQAASGHAMVSFLSVDSISLAKGKMVSANDEMTNTSQMRWAKGRASERRRQNETKRVRAFNISRKSTQSYFISGLPNTLKSAHVSSRTRATKQMPSHGLARCCRQTRRCIVRLEWCSVFTLVHTGRAIEWYPPKRKKNPNKHQSDSFRSIRQQHFAFSRCFYHTWHGSFAIGLECVNKINEF